MINFPTKNVLPKDLLAKFGPSWKLLIWPLPIEIGSSTSSHFSSAESGSNRNSSRAFGKNGILFHPTISKNVGLVNRWARFFVWTIWFRFPFESRLTSPLIPFYRFITINFLQIFKLFIITIIFYSSGNIISNYGPERKNYKFVNEGLSNFEPGWECPGTNASDHHRQISLESFFIFIPLFHVFLDF